jgi:hypothetical protein
VAAIVEQLGERCIGCGRVPGDILVLLRAVEAGAERIEEGRIREGIIGRHVV